MYRKVEESQTLLINTQSKNLISQNKKVIKFGFGQSPFLPPQKAMEELSKAVKHKEYSSVQGDSELRSLISQFHKDHNGLDSRPDNIFIAPGSKILLFSVLLAYKEADFFIPAPSWVSYAPQAKLAGHHIIKLQTNFENRWRVTPEIIEQAVKNKKYGPSLMILNYPGNPDGLTYSEDELKKLAEIAKKNDILVISDEIYGLLNHSFNHKSFAEYYPEKTITTTGLSKWCGAGGWRLGAAILSEGIDPKLKEVLLGIASETYSCAPSPVQMAAKKAYENFEELSMYLKSQVDILKLTGNYCADKLHQNEVRVHSPEGGFYLFPDFSNYKEKFLNNGIDTSAKMCEDLLENAGVALLPASAFGFDEQYYAARLAYVDFNDPLQANKKFDLASDAPKVVEGIELITQWLKSF